MFRKEIKHRLSVRLSSAAVAVMIFVGGMPSESQAGMKEALNQVFISTSTAPSSIATQRLKGVYGGSMSFRPAGRGIEVVQFALPRIEAGCGGIDLFFGSFSFINGAQFEQLIRAIAANAVGYAIKAAINGMCSPCGAQLQALEDAMRELNALMKNTCAIGSAMFDPNAMKNVKESARKIGNSLSTAFGVKADAAAAENDGNAKTPTEQASGGSPGLAEYNPLEGNLVHRAAKATMNRGANTLRAFLTEKEIIEFVMALYSTVIVTPDKTSGAANCPPGVGAQSCDKNPEDWGPTIANWDQLFYPREHTAAGVTVLTCQNTDCTRIGPSVVPLSTWGGITDIINIGLFGSATPGAANTYTTNSIIGSFIHNSEAPLSPQANAIVQATPFPILSILLELQKIPGAPELFGTQVAAMLPDYLAYTMGIELLTIGSNVFSAQTQVDKFAKYTEALTDKQRQIIQMRPKEGAMALMLKTAIDNVKMMQELTASPYRSGSSGGSK